MKTSGRTIIIALAVSLLILPLLVACSSGDDEEPSPLVKPADQPTATSEPTELLPDEVTITIGVISDLTGPSAETHRLINMAMKDLAEYFNQEKLDPGVKFEMIFYDGANDPSNDIPGYQWLREKKSDVIFSAQPVTAATLKPKVDEDQMVMFVASGDADIILPPGYVFAVATLPQYEAYSLLKWVAENDWDYEANGPAKVGGATWSDAYGNAFLAAMEEYCDAHPDQFEWIGGYLTPLGNFIWGPEVDALKDADYVFPCVLLTNFVREYRAAGYSAKIIGAGIHTAFFGLVHDARLWDEIDGAIFLMGSPWWTDEGELMDLTKKLLNENHANDAEAIMRKGVGYSVITSLYPMFDIITQAYQASGPETFGSQAIYDAAQQYSLELNGITRYTFSETKRDLFDAYKVYIADETQEDMFPADGQWIPVTREP